jgi:hypothetical protein
VSREVEGHAQALLASFQISGEGKKVSGVGHNSLILDNFRILKTGTFTKM